MTAPRHLLILRTGSLGDIVHTLPAVWALRHHFPDARIEWLIEARFAPVLRGNGCLDALIELPERPGRSLWVQGVAATIAVARLRERRFDVALDLQGLLRTALWSRLAGAPLRLGPDDWREGAPLLYSRTLSRGGAAHVVDQWLAVAGQLGARTEKVEFRLRPTEDEVRSVLGSLGGDAGRIAGPDRRWAVLFPRTAWARKDWPWRRWAALARWLSSEAGLGVLVAGGQADRATCESIVAASRDGQSSQAAPVAACTVPLEQLKVLLANAALVAGSDSGPVHWAAAMDTPVVSLFGPTNPARYQPRGDGRVEVVRRSEACRACASAINRKGETWPWGPAHTCMAAIGLDDVCEAVMRALGHNFAGTIETSHDGRRPRPKAPETV